MNDTERTALQGTLATLSGAATAAGTVLTGPSAIVARVIAAALGVASAMLSQGATPQQAVDAIKRVKHIDTRADDAAVDAKIAAKRSGTADTAPAPSASVPEMHLRLASLKREAAGNTDAVRVEHLQAEIAVIERELTKRGAWGEPASEKD